MRATPIAMIVLAMAMSPLAIAQTTDQGTTPPASSTIPSPATTTLQQNQANRDADGMSKKDRERARTRLGVGATGTGQMLDRASANMRQISVNDLEDMDVYNTQGEKVGDVEEIVGGTGDQRYVVIAEGGFFGVGEDHAALPLDRFWAQGNDRLVVQGVTDEDIETMGNYRGNTGDYKEVDDDDMIELATWQQS